jgi:uncharacterized damage-inducible protein DinB
MNRTEQISSDLTRNYNVLLAQLDGLTHEDALLQVPFRGNCLNWVLGHMLTYRAAMLALIGAKPLDGAGAYERYGHGSEPVTSDGSDVVNLDRMRSDLAVTEERLSARLPEMTDAELQHLPADEERTVIQRLGFLAWHDTYHTGQTEYLRQLAGTDDKVI